MTAQRKIAFCALAVATSVASYACKRAAPPPPHVTTVVASVSAPVAHVASATPPPARLPSTACAVFGAFPLSAPKGADALRAKLAAAGVDGVEVHDASDYDELAWGQLVVVAPEPDRATAQARVDAARAVQKGYVKACSERGGDLAPSPDAATADASSRGCVGWNPAARRAVCITGTSSLQQGAELVVEELGGDANFDWLKTPGMTFDAKPAASAVSQLRSLLATGKYTSLAYHYARLLPPHGEAAWGTPKLVFRYTRHDEPEVRTPEGSWNDVSDRIELDCGGRKRTLFDDRVQGSNSEPAELHWAPAAHVILVVWHRSWNVEGGSGDATDAALIDTEKDPCVDPVL